MITIKRVKINTGLKWYRFVIIIISNITINNNIMILAINVT
ncbi:putative membrane protein [Chlamydia psittaci 03DC29]|nr:putative membrane protein [Chlamydia psittaci 02DC22]EPJ23123.1 putative membrane protein [Chlamydia psittaci 08DC60]EPJ26178.1 putative membrane protein [Chlamydia psittaci 03DC29]EPJ28800.1 putative membrane protein [Chlamydia psittaci 09DC78]EPL02240.1 putative membrane protein [Chlamydia psittaci 09DC79]EPP33162.1 putative membrane protein [Chlamydia psittaci C6/98]